MRFQFLQDRVAETYNNLSLFLEITFRFHSTMPSRVMLKLAVLAVQSCQLPNLSHLLSWDQTICSISSGWLGKPYPQPHLVPFSA